MVDEEALQVLDYIYAVTSDPHFEPELQFIQVDQRDLLNPELKDGQDSSTAPKNLFDGRDYKPGQLEYAIGQLADQGYVQLRRGPATVHWVRITPDGHTVAEQRSQAS